MHYQTPPVDFEQAGNFAIILRCDQRDYSPVQQTVNLYGIQVLLDLLPRPRSIFAKIFDAPETFSFFSKSSSLAKLPVRVSVRVSVRVPALTLPGHWSRGELPWWAPVPRPGTTRERCDVDGPCGKNPLDSALPWSPLR